MSSINIIENIITFMLIVFFLQNSYILRNNAEKDGRSRQATDDSVPWISKATDMHSEYVLYIVFPQQHWLNECTSMLRPYMSCYKSAQYTATIVMF